ncbi:MAG: FAD-dependent oxidoreductase [Clostridiales bacterium]|nr:FAD-dependent oxidoreductase [Candidatus Equinaster intestinalis]
MKSYDLIVLGAGMSGCGAAIAAAREGISVLLVDKSGFLGGAAGNNLVTPFMRSHTKIDGKDFPLCRGIFAEIQNELMNYGKHTDTAYKYGYFNCEYLKVLLTEKCIKAGVELLLHSTLCDLKKEGETIKSITVTAKGQRFELAAKRFIDASGDADLAAMAGYPFKIGREDGLCQPMTLCFRIAGINREIFDTEYKNIDPLYKEFKKQGKIKNPREDVLFFNTLDPSVLHFNSTRVIRLNPTDPFDLTRAELESQKQMIELYLFLKNNFESFKNSYISQAAAEIGVRESRMICGEHTLTGEEILSLKKPYDTIALGNYDIDIHSPTGEGTSHHFFGEGEYYGIPYRCLIPKNAENLLVAGRCISGTHEAQASFRIMPIVCCIGEAAGTAIAQLTKTNKSVKDIDIAALQQTLKNNGALPEKY